MANLPGRLGTLTARDVMTSKVIVVNEQEPLEAAAATLRKHHITGAPVVDEQNHLVGILSIRDMIPGENGLPETVLPTSPLPHGGGKETWDLYERAAFSNPQMTTDKVYSRMSQPVTSVSPDAPLVEVARVMCDHHWHHLPVADADNELLGMITTLDVLAALVNAADEQG